MNTGTGRMDDDARKQFVKKKHTWKKGKRGKGKTR
jgi:hypothetical protein